MNLRVVHDNVTRGVQYLGTQAKRGLKAVQAKSVDIFKKNVKPAPECKRTCKELSPKRRQENAKNIFDYLSTLEVKKFTCTPADVAVAAKYCVQRAEEGNVSKEESKKMRAFFTKISTLGTNMFDRHALLSGKEALQRILSADLNSLIQLQEKNSELVDDTNHQLQVGLAKAKLATSLGHGLETANKGNNGTQLVRDLENNLVGVFKAPAEVKFYHVFAKLKQYFGQVRLLNQKDQLAQQYAEVASYKFDEAFGFKLAPKATMAKINGQDGAFISFLKGYKELKEVKASLESRKEYTKEEKILWQKMCLYNFAVCGLDPHAENIFVKTDTKGHLTDIRMIDGGNNFAEHNPGKWGSKGNQGHWGNFRLSKNAFEPEMLDFIRKDLTMDKLESFVKEVGKERGEYWSQRMDMLQRQRLQVLMNGVASGKIKTPADLAKIHTDADMKKYLQQQPDTEKTKKVVDGFVVFDV